MYPSPSETLEVMCGYQFLFTALLVKAELTCPHHSLSDHQRVLMGDSHIQLPSQPAGPAKARHKSSALGDFGSRGSETRCISRSECTEILPMYMSNPAMLWVILSITRGPQVHYHSCKAR